MSPSGGPTKGGTSVTVPGTGFGLETSATTIKFGTAKAASVNCVSQTSCMVVRTVGNFRERVGSG